MIGWSDVHTYTGRRDLEALIMSAAPRMVFCPHCWGDGRIWFKPLDDRRYVPGNCARCAGTGQVVA